MNDVILSACKDKDVYENVQKVDKDGFKENEKEIIRKNDVEIVFPKPMKLTRSKSL